MSKEMENDLKLLWEKEAQLDMHGWNFDHLKGRWLNKEMPWDYRKIVLKYLKQDASLLDMATGGGELLLSFKHNTARTSATESWLPNIKVIKERLLPLGIKIYPTKTEEELPIKDDSVDFITNSHAAFNAASVYKKLHTGGFFITEQVGATNNFSLSRYLDESYTPPYPESTLLNSIINLKSAGFEILLAKQSFPELIFFDVGAVVYYATVIPWEFKNFNIDQCFDKLLSLQKLIDANQYISTNEDRFIIVARKRA
ncbi:MAG: SAM-dependent methyltransferase [Liquorilactobacillus nagelii]|uniref:SAM-dependent methyltransferase n=2 Tax=Liquorilactobacillus nagelii TaxID=82688 RepID=A0A3Q8CBZ9_9LACO|nr:class I SAM-dependent methyltransferase [Liquorilactobacillus nagelii]AUJ32157.1 SAM-dependent methyltransferase [Liquorilactobacillus nagelii]MCC7615323.1 SAM-dependent methyltransferase [Liquorilactobacillus nagelii]MCP9315429.1 SAM-dependent methyltransferase [Liquorilactobacillus nagelii]